MVDGFDVLDAADVRREARIFLELGTLDRVEHSQRHGLGARGQSYPLAILAAVGVARNGVGQTRSHARLHVTELVPRHRQGAEQLHERLVQREIEDLPAGAVHRFHDFTPDFAVWAVFYGPEGGEKP